MNKVSDGSQDAPQSETMTEAEILWAKLPEAVLHLPPAVRHRAENSFEGFARAKTLLSIDREIASFRAITAEEEAAAALIRSLQLRNYPGAEKIDLRLHQHKAAVGFFLATVQQTIFDQSPIIFRLTLTVNPPSLSVAMPVSQFSDAPAMADLQLVMSEPLGGIATTPGVEEENYFDAAVATVAGGRKVDKLLAAQVNARNRILYAHDSGVPLSQVTPAMIELRERRGHICVLLSIAVLQVETHQAFALQCLKGFLKVIGRQPPVTYT